jgi:hypothetical protein
MGLRLRQASEGKQGYEGVTRERTSKEDYLCDSV